MKNYTGLRRLLAASLMVACGFGTSGHAQNAATNAPPPAAATLNGDPVKAHIEHVQRRPLTPAELAPHKADDPRLRADYDRPLHDPSQPEALRLFNMAAAASCDAADFAAASGNGLVDLVKSVPVTCLNTLYDLKGTVAGQVFAEAKMITVANAMQAAAAGYPGDNSTQMLQLITFLRAGYYVQYSYPSDVGNYGSNLESAAKLATDAFAASPHFLDVSDGHGPILNEFITLIDSTEQNAAYLDTFKLLLDSYNSATYDAFASMRKATNNVFTVLYLGHYRNGFAAAVQADPSVIDSLSGFIQRNAAKAGSSTEYMVVNAASEMTRFLQYSSLKPKVRPLTKAVLDAFPFDGPGLAIYVAAANMADYYDHANCDYYGICTFKDDLEDIVLPIAHDCSPNVHMRAQALTPQEVEQACTLLLGETDYFHNVAKTGKVPVADDNNVKLELVVFDSSADYKKYAGTLFGISTDNGGMYLEGNPASPNNLPRFIAYRAEWLPDFSIWNLTHEYVHYLDGRFNMYGDFGAATSAPTIWWIEGFAEYVSYSYRNMAYADALSAAGTGKYPLSTIFANDYNSGTERVYYWGYLATRYMFERHPGQVDNILGFFRKGKYSDYASYLEGIRYGSDTDWSSWLLCLNVNGGDSSSCGGAIPEPPMDVVLTNDVALGGQSGTAGNAQVYKLVVPAKATSLSLRTMGGAGDVSLYVKKDGKPTASDYGYKSARPGNNESVTIAKPEPGTYYLLVVGESAYSGVTVHARYKAAPLPPSLPECTNSDERVFTANCQRSNLSGPKSTNPRYFYYYVPAGTAKITIASMGGTGNVDLYAGPNWATSTAYAYKSTGPDNNEEIVLDNPAAGYLYFSLIGADAYSDVQLRLTVVPTTP
ncbi:hypothetical protein ASG87_18060 [Frateuria sp. Soil773]|uniref:M9 family metallopeptidase n=1 Tax=Frateuria sp. Soil773 TaxID=1736407 RepID=UPI0006F7F9DB|nr:M9 family metallopeptidase [Frateuria sp. Soil773]KRE93743.1 hypothetical protein ASG87_18060 [Frateuria sp. Soil773]